MELKYVAVKLVNLKPWLWFKVENIVENKGRFEGCGGWGREGSGVKINVDADLIEGRIYSEDLMYI